ncbi:MAG: hypothetical protein U9P44_02255 [archaeon]|nr:hypothetical protein [archaeon]
MIEQELKITTCYLEKQLIAVSIKYVRCIIRKKIKIKMYDQEKRPIIVFTVYGIDVDDLSVLDYFNDYKLSSDIFDFQQKIRMVFIDGLGIRAVSSINPLIDFFMCMVVVGSWDYEVIDDWPCPFSSYIISLYGA